MCTKKNAFTFFSHGTRCAGEVAAARDNGVCGVGVAYDSKIAGKHFQINVNQLFKIKQTHSYTAYFALHVLVCPKLRIQCRICISKWKCQTYTFHNITHIFINNKINTTHV